MLIAERTGEVWFSDKEDPRAQEHLKPITQIATADFHLYEVVDSFEAAQDASRSASK